MRTKTLIVVSTLIACLIAEDTAHAATGKPKPIPCPAAIVDIKSGQYVTRAGHKCYAKTNEAKKAGFTLAVSQPAPQCIPTPTNGEALAALVDFSIIQQEQFTRVLQDFSIIPSLNHVFVGYLVSVKNNSNLTIESFQTYAPNSFRIVSTDGFEFRAIDLSAAAWTKNRLVWNIKSIPPGETRQGWIVFDFPNDKTPKSIAFRVLSGFVEQYKFIPAS